MIEQPLPARKKSCLNSKTAQRIDDFPVVAGDFVAVLAKIEGQRDEPFAMGKLHASNRSALVAGRRRKSSQRRRAVRSRDRKARGESPSRRGVQPARPRTSMRRRDPPAGLCANGRTQRMQEERQQPIPGINSFSAMPMRSILTIRSQIPLRICSKFSLRKI